MLNYFLLHRLRRRHRRRFPLQLRRRLFHQQNLDWQFLLLLSLVFRYYFPKNHHQNHQIRQRRQNHHQISSLSRRQ
jgi:hypothetical protein